MPFPNHHSRPIFRLQAAFLAFSLRSKSKFPDTARSSQPILAGKALKIWRDLDEAECFRMKATRTPTVEGQSGFRGCNGHFESIRKWQFFFAQLPIHTKPHAEINEIHFRKSGFRLLLRPICFCFLPSFERTNRQWVIRARINAPPAKHAGMSKLIARICHLSPFRIISS